MNTTITENDVEQIFERFHLAESRYRAAQEHLTATQEQFQRNQKTLELARQEADSLNREWKQLLRDANGKTNKEVMQKLEASRNARDIADELEPILESAPEILEAAEVEALTAREAYRNELKAAREAMLSHQLAEAVEAVQSVPEFQRFMFALSLYLKSKKASYADEARWGMTGHHPGEGGALVAADLEQIDRAARDRTANHLMEVIHSAGLIKDVDPHTGLEEIPETEQERQSALKGSPLRLKQARARLAASA
jgi:dsDNA-binding SOS-regulon protein